MNETSIEINKNLIKIYQLYIGYRDYSEEISKSQREILKQEKEQKEYQDFVDKNCPEKWMKEI